MVVGQKVVNHDVGENVVWSKVTMSKKAVPDSPKVEV